MRMNSGTRLLFALIALAIACAFAATAADDPRAALLGIWRGSSICTGARAACRDETVVCHVRPGAKPDMVTFAMNKVVDGKELEMGDLDFKIDFAAHRLVSDYDNGRVATRWSFTWTEKKLVGTAVTMPDGTKIRDIVLHR
jgi:hypothetical protein